MFFGIDLGNTKSVISFSQITDNGRIDATPIEIERVSDFSVGVEDDKKYAYINATTLPSYVYYGYGQQLVGDYAKSQYIKHPEVVAKSIKSQMGKSETKGLSTSISNATPESINARILYHLKTEAEKKIGKKINQVVIAVPSNFDAAKREATMNAAEKAGFDDKNPDGSWNPILISEPNAVLCDLINNTNKTISKSKINFTENKKIIVFDMGSGVLDVTFSEVGRNSEDGSSFVISEVATAEFTNMSGDYFDETIAESLYDRCIESLKIHNPSIVPHIQTNKRIVKKRLVMTAEQLKIEMSTCLYSSSSKTMNSSEPTVDISVAIVDNYIYNDTITKSEFEEMVSPLLGKDYSFKDYRRYIKNNKTHKDITIVDPIFDVLKKAALYYEGLGEDISVDVVILTGGMSKLYLVKERIKDFFGIDPITITNPDFCVANGAAVYATITSADGLKNRITIKRRTQKDNLYLGLFSGANNLLITAGEKLPFKKEICGYQLPPGRQTIEFTINKAHTENAFKTIARSSIKLKNKPKQPLDVKVEACFDESGILTIKAFVYNRAQQVIDGGKVEIALGAPVAKKYGGAKIIPSGGINVNPANELDSLKNMFSSKNKSKNKQIESKMQTILNSNNPEAFEDVVIKHLDASGDTKFRRHLYEIVEALFPAWSEAGIKRLIEVAQKDVTSSNLGFAANSSRAILSNYVLEVLDKLNG